MQTALTWLLEKLEAEGRHDLVAQYHEHNRQYQRDGAIRSRERKIAQIDETLASGTHPDHAAFLHKQKAKLEEAIARLRNGQDATTAEESARIAAEVEAWQEAEREQIELL